jgi:hypothetical protein
MASISDPKKLNAADTKEFFGQRLHRKTNSQVKQKAIGNAARTRILTLQNRLMQRAAKLESLTNDILDLVSTLSEFDDWDLYPPVGRK